MRSWTTSFSDNIPTTLRVISISAVLSTALLATACTSTEFHRLPVEAYARQPVTKTIQPMPVAFVVAERAPRRAAHCNEVADLRASDVQRDGFELAVQDHARQYAFAECMRWAFPE